MASDRPHTLILLLSFISGFGFMFYTQYKGLSSLYIKKEDYFETQSKPPPLRRRNNNIPTILDLVGSTDDYTCPENFVLVKDTIDPSFYKTTTNEEDKTQQQQQYLIPKVIHMTSKSRCMPKDFSDNIDKWRFPGYSLFLHDDDAVNRLLTHPWPELPHIQHVTRCMQPGASISDLWRYVIVWKYGGIYTDVDNAPGTMLFDERIGHIRDIKEDTDALFEQEGGRFPSQYFFAASPHHPVMFFSAHHCLSRVMEVLDVKDQYIPFVTGPGATKKAVIEFMGGDGYPKKGTYVGKDIKHRNITIIGSVKEANLKVYIDRATRAIKKNEGYVKMNMTHFDWKENKEKFPEISCVHVLYALQDKKMMEKYDFFQDYF